MNPDEPTRPPHIADDPQLRSSVEAPLDLDGPVGETDADPARRDLRAEIGKYVSLVPFPATGQQIIDVASARHAPEVVLRELRTLPTDATVHTPRDLWTALGLRETERF